MVAYSFQKRFVPLIRQGLKTQTIRANRKRHVRVGQLIQLYTAMRTAQCERIIPDTPCTGIHPISIEWDGARIARIVVGGLPVRNHDGFATLNGFASIEDMTEFWLQHHGPLPFQGVVIEWSMPREDARWP